MENAVVSFADNVIAHPELETFAEDDALLKEKIYILQQELDESLPCEKDFREQLNQTLIQLKNHHNHLNKMKQFADLGYKELSLEPFTWSRTIKLKERYNLYSDRVFVVDIIAPTFAIIPLTHADNFEFTTQYDRRQLAFYLARDLPIEILQKYYHDFQSHHGGSKHFINAPTQLSSDSRTSYTLKDSFKGVIPHTIKQQIKEAKKFFKEIFVVWEGVWDVTKTPNPDPLIVGWDDGDKKLWLIDMFDTTPVEEAFSMSVKTDKPASETVKNILKMTKEPK